MDIDLIFKIAGTGIIVAVLNLVLKRAEREASMTLSLQETTRSLHFPTRQPQRRYLQKDL